MKFDKVHACGNDFVLLYEIPDSAFIESMCHRQLGIGGDGIMVYLGRDVSGSPVLQHFDPDGSRSFCLNGLRSALACLHQQGKVARSGGLAYEGQQVDYEIGKHVAVALAPAQIRAQRVVVDARAFDGFFALAGCPHYLVLDRAFAGEGFAELAVKLRWHADFEAGANVHALWQADDGWRIRSFERGVEDLTLACGSGILAAATLLRDRDQQSVLRFVPDGGDFVQVRRESGKMILEGPTHWVASGVWRC